MVVEEVVVMGTREVFEKWRKEERERHKITPVNLHKMPTWFRRRMRAAIRTHRYWTPCDGLRSLGVEFGCGRHVFDHWGTGVDGSFISEPYDKIGDVKFEQAVKDISDVLGIEYAITGPMTSWWFPGRTIRVSFFETLKSKPIEQIRFERKKRELEGVA